MSSIESTSSSNSFAGLFSPLASVAANYLQDKMHTKMDTDSDGVVAKSEFQSALEEVGVKLGVDSGDNADAMFAEVDTDGNGSLTGNEVGQMLKSMFSGGTDTDAFVQSRGDEQRFAELDADGDGNISAAEFGISAASSESASDVIVDSTTTTSDEALVAADTGTTDALNEEDMQALMGTVDSDGDGQINDTEIAEFVSKLGTQMSVASKKYSDTAIASFSTSQVSEEA
jgi:Ca2+-binding EF-hand superfamily protein